VLSLLADAAEKSRESISIFLTGAKEEIEAKLFAHTPALRSRLKEVTYFYSDLFILLVLIFIITSFIIIIIIRMIALHLSDGR